jgi:WD40 repeat protein
MRIQSLGILLFMLTGLLGAETNTVLVPGQNLLWNPTENVFIFAKTGKTSGEQIWHLFDPAGDGDLDTLFYGKNMTPVWSYDGKYVAYQKGSNVIIMDDKKNTTSFPSQVSAVDTIAWSPDVLKLMYSGDNKLFLYDFTLRGGSLVTYGRKPLMLQQNRGLIFSDDEFNIYYLDQTMEKSLLLSDIDDFRVSRDGSMLIAWNGKDKRFIKMDLVTKSTTDFMLADNISGFDLSPDSTYLIYAVNNGGIMIRNIKSGQEVQLFSEGIFPRFSFDGSWLSCEMPKSDARVMRSAAFSNRLPVAVFIKINLGKKDGLKPGDIVKVYEERLNPFTKQVVGYDPDRYKTDLKVLNVFESFAMTQDKAAVSKVELNDAAVIPDRNLLGAVTGIEK